MMTRIVLATLALVAVLLLSGCLGGENDVEEPSIEEQAKQACITACLRAKSEARDLSDGPCLNSGFMEDWVCDVVHSPRREVDNLPENQCEAYLNGEANHFVEVDENCVVIMVG